MIRIQMQMPSIVKFNPNSKKNTEKGVTQKPCKFRDSYSKYIFGYKYLGSGIFYFFILPKKKAQIESNISFDKIYYLKIRLIPSS